MKWIWVIVLVIIGILAAIVAVEYLTVAIHALPSWIPGHKRTGRGHYHKRGAVAAIIAVVAFVIAGYLAYRNLRLQPADAGSPPSSSPPVSGQGSADQILSSPTPEPGPADEG
jgi:hypothetical protein